MSLPQAVLFDLGKVLVDFEWLIAARRISAHAGQRPEALIELLRASDVVVRYEKGELTNSEFFDEVRREIGYQKGENDFRQAFSEIFSEIPEMVGLLPTIRSAGIPTWLFSNTNDWAIGHIRARFPFFSNFDGYLLSYQLGVMKPDVRIYEAAEAATGRRGRDILYIDDIAENVAAGTARGWRTIHHRTPELTIAQVTQIFAG